MIFTETPEIASSLALNGGLTTYDLYPPTGNDLDDLLAISQYSNFILSNSTYSLWAALLSPRPNKTVIAPSHIASTKISTWLDHKDLPSDWVLL